MEDSGLITIPEGGLWAAELGSPTPPIDWAPAGGASAALARMAATYGPRLDGVGPVALDDATADALLADLAAVFEDQLHLHSRTLGLSPDESAAFAAFARRALRAAGADRLRTTPHVRTPEVRLAWLAALGPLASTPVVQVHEAPAGPRVRYCLYATGAERRFRVVSGGVLADSKVRSVRFFGEHWVHEHNLLVDTADPAGARFGVAAASADAPDAAPTPAIERGGEPRTLPQLRAEAGTPHGPGDPEPGRRFDRDWWARKRLGIPWRLLHTLGGTRRFRDAWVLADRVDQANDNAEVLFRHLHTHRPDINAWFVVDRRVPVYRELKRAGAKVLPYGGLRHFALMKSARVFACSQSDNESRLPFGPRYMHQSWRFVYLKHGIIHTDHHRRFNPMQIQLALAATEAERELLAEDGGPYRFASTEVALTGMPRHDRLDAALANARERGDRRILLIAPTWRISLGYKNPDHTWSVVPEFASTTYVRAWRELLNDARLRDACAAAGLDPVFLLHPRFERHATHFGIPDWMRTETYRTDISGLMARTGALVTDYSSLAFEAAYVGAPTAYFQFDRDEFFSGAHSSQAGDFVYERDGFGPVAETAAGAVEAIAALLAEGPQPAARSRIEGLYARRDGRNCARAVEAIAALP